jgi:DNA mismatch endonuclease, patch repair protein
MDNLTRAQRSLCMSRVRNVNTDLEVQLRRELHRRGFRYVLHRKDLAGTPDIVFVSSKVAVFVNGDFWHGFGFSRWAHKLSPFWHNKIELNRRRDKRNTSKLRRAGWHVITIWQHQLKHNLDGCVDKVINRLNNSARTRRMRSEGSNA